jgi:transcriptional regulator with XRE-family HTH domain
MYPGEKIMSLLAKEKIHETQFARNLGIDPSYFLKMLKGKRPIRLDYLEKVAKALNVPVWELLRPDEVAESFQPLQPIITVLGHYPEMPSEIRTEDYFAVPMVEGRIAAGYPGAIPGDYVTDMVWVYKPEIGRRQHHNLRAVKLGKDATSMEPTIRRGSIVIIDPIDQEISKKAIFAVRLDASEGTCAIKRVTDAGDYWVLSSDNPDWEPFVMEKRRHPDLIIGRVIWSWTSWIS